MDKEKLYHFVGIKGSGMSSLALLVHGQGYRVQGSDYDEYYFTQVGLEAAHITLLPFAADNITEEMVIIQGNAFPDNHEEIVRARELGCPVYRYHDFLGQLINNQVSIAVTGSHGKTTTTGLVAHVLKHICPTNYLIGDGTGRGMEHAEYVAIEACEYRRHFLAYHPDYAIITNVDFDHPDYYTSLEDVFSAFETFAQQVGKRLILCGEDAHLRRLRTLPYSFYYGLESSDASEFVNNAVASNIKRTTEGSRFDVTIDGTFYGTFLVPAYGMHNVLNALATISLCYLEQLPADKVAEALRTFRGVKRRFAERRFEDIVVIDDYAHHPSEIVATIDAARQKYPNKPIIAVFQPHTYSRTTALLQEFAMSLATADAVYLFDIFPSEREKREDSAVQIEDLAELIHKPTTVLDVAHMSPLLEYQDAVLLFMGAGSIDKISEKYSELLGHIQGTVS